MSKLSLDDFLYFFVGVGCLACALFLIVIAFRSI